MMDRKDAVIRAIRAAMARAGLYSAADLAEESGIALHRVARWLAQGKGQLSILDRMGATMGTSSAEILAEADRIQRAG
jgi:hypothetical protein